MKLFSYSKVLRLVRFLSVRLETLEYIRLVISRVYRSTLRSFFHGGMNKLAKVTAATGDLAKLDYLLKWNRVLLRSFGVWPLNHTTTSRLERLGTFLLIFNLGTLVVAEWIDLIKIWGHLDLMLNNLTANLGTSLALVKLLIIRWHVDTLQGLIADVQNDWSEGYTAKDCEVMMVRAKIARWFSIVGPVLALPSGLFFALTPQVIMYSKNGTEIAMLMPFRSTYFFDVTSTPVYQFTYFSQVVACCTSSAAYSGIDCFFAALAFHVCGQLEILGNAIRGLERKDYRIVKNFVERHLRLIQYMNDLESIYSAVIFGQLLTTSLAICSIGFKFIMSLDTGDFGDMGKFSIYLSAILIHIFLYCYSGQCLIDQSTHLSEAAYSSPWYQMKGSDGRAFILIQSRAQTPFQITALKFCVMSHSCFADILRTSATYFSVLRAIK
ncbi:odorant receptor 4-like [Diprion similis]|uniref:odorant receptor 4-like n=1 Tax=Diprion similis TaxID=362088 RepID=UPI001EF8021A|nr:odorant receptor 4-like [Diprion similis]